MLTMTGTNSEAAKLMATNIVAFETKMAKPRLDKVASRNPLLFLQPIATSKS
jgi:putative endopeptidase